ncbi:unnamed protein product [Owenia fusiformis]|uniref:Uncharacterized protein n=1 Tax=Owenia fusiformis TaxID=6347 RepID=A0A8J1TFG5_OWEFU|nr:unnamed protein product [Owenia fusiformis]
MNCIRGTLAICVIAVSALRWANAEGTAAARDPFPPCRDATTCTCEPVINVTPQLMGYCDCKNLTNWLSNTTSGLSEAEENIAELATDVTDLKASVDELKGDSHEPDSNDESDFANYYDEIAQATCTAMNTEGGWTYAVRIACSGSRTCTAICSDAQLRAQDVYVADKIMTCFNSLHVYWDRPKFAHGEAGYEKLGLKIYRYNNCGGGYCGPNYCCCRSI